MSFDRARLTRSRVGIINSKLILLYRDEVNHMSSYSSNTAVAAQAPANAPASTAVKTRASADVPMRPLPYRPAQQVELLNLHAELDALLYQLNAATHRKALLHR